MKLNRRARRQAAKTGTLPFIGPQPVAQTYRIDRGGSWVVVSMSGPCGQWVTFLKPDDASQFADEILTAAVEVRSGIEVVRDDKQLEVVTHAGGKR